MLYTLCMKIYTKAGDKGKTTLCDGKTVSKTDLRVCACGAVDELNCILGEALSKNGPKILNIVQKDLFNIGSILAKAKVKMEFSVPVIENEIDRIENMLPKLQSFIMPGGSELGGKLHTARAFCRRAEREVCKVSGSKTILLPIIQYLNRVSDLLFVLARYTNMNCGRGDKKLH